jgi:phage-related protein
MQEDKPLFILYGEIKTPPMSEVERRKAGLLLRSLQQGDSLSLPESRPMPTIGPKCHELRINQWRIFYRVDSDAIIILEVHQKKTRKTPQQVLDTCRQRTKSYDSSFN